jgi:hypothetical protein
MAHVATVTIDNTKVDADLTDYVVYVNLANLPSSFWNVVLDGGGDIRCYKSDGVTELAREIVSCVQSSDTGEMYIKYAGTLSNTSDTVIQIHADGSSSEPSPSATYGKYNVWTNYKFVSHGGGTTDSKAGVAGTASGGVSAGGATGKLGDATQYDGTDDKIHFGDVGDMGSDNTTFQFWVNDTNNGVILAKSNGGSPVNNYGYLIPARDFFSSGTIGFAGADTTGGWEANNVSMGMGANPTRTAGVWYKYDLCIVQGGSAGNVIYQNGSALSTRVGGYLPTTSNDNALNLTIADESDGTDRYSGYIDEIRIRTGALASTWLSTEYNNQNSPSTFYSVTAVSTSSTQGLMAWF